MNILIDIGHPAHVHYFRNFYKIMTGRGHNILVTARKKEVSHDLLESYGIPYVDRGEGSSSLAGKLLYLPKANWILLREARRFSPDLFMSFSSPYAAQVSSVMRKPHIALDDTEHAWLGRMMYRPFTDVILSPDSYNGSAGERQSLFNGFLELCYLHPNHFAPDERVLPMVGVRQGEPFVLMRFVSWQAAHDAGHSGVSLENKRRAVREFSRYAKVLVSSESELPEDLKPYGLSIPPNRMHDLLAFATLFYGESATMASESAVCGTPAIYLDNDGRGYTDQLESRYRLVFNYTESEEDQQRSIAKGVDILRSKEMKSLFENNRKKLLSEKIDVTTYLVEFVEKYIR